MNVNGYAYTCTGGRWSLVCVCVFFFAFELDHIYYTNACALRFMVNWGGPRRRRVVYRLYMGAHN